MDNDLLNTWLRRPDARDLVDQIAREREDAEDARKQAEDARKQAEDARKQAEEKAEEDYQALEACCAADIDTAHKHLDEARAALAATREELAKCRAESLVLQGENARLYARQYWYLATPYAAHPEGLQVAYTCAVDALTCLLTTGVAAVSPIVLGHPVAVLGNLDGTDPTIWRPYNNALMACARGLIVLKAPGWAKSQGIRYEIERMALIGRPIHYMKPGIVPAEVFA